MSNRLPEKITHIDIFKIERGKRKLCECRNPHYEIDTRNRLVMCLDCGAVVDPFEALVEIAVHYDRLNNQVENLLSQAKEIQDYKPHLKVIKEIEHRYRANKFSMLPCCPNCGEAFELTEISAWKNRKYCHREREEP